MNNPNPMNAFNANNAGNKKKNVARTNRRHEELSSAPNLSTLNAS